MSDDDRRSQSFTVLRDHDALELLKSDGEDMAIAREPQRPVRAMRSQARPAPDRALAPLFECYQALLNLRERTEQEEAAKDAVWALLVAVREAEDPQ